MGYGYSSTGAFRKAKWWLDIINIVFSVAIIVIFVLSFFVDVLKENRFVIILSLGAALNGLSGVKKLLSSSKTEGIVLLVVAALLLLVMGLCIAV